VLLGSVVQLAFRVPLDQTDRRVGSVLPEQLEQAACKVILGPRESRVPLAQQAPWDRLVSLVLADQPVIQGMSELRDQPVPQVFLDLLDSLELLEILAPVDWLEVWELPVNVALLELVEVLDRLE